MTGGQYKNCKTLIDRQIKEMEFEAVKTAKIIGIKNSNMDIDVYFYKDYQPIGEACSIPKTWEEALSQAYPGCAIAAVVIRDKSEF